MTDDTIVKAPAATQAGTEYVVLMLVDFPDAEDGAITSGWMQVGGKTHARNAEDAVREKAAIDGKQPRKYVAIPSRSWKPISVKAETVTTLKLEEVT